MNRIAYSTTGLAIKMLSSLSKANINLYGTDNIPTGSIIFVINHFTRIETLLMPYYIFNLTKIPVWSLATYEIFKGPLSTLLDKVGAVSTKNPDRDRLIVKTLLTGEASWIIFPEGRMVKNKKIIEKGRYMISYAGGKHPPHTGAATLALRTEFYRQRLQKLIVTDPPEAEYLLDLFQIESIDPVLDRETFIVPVSITYYPIRARENILSSLAVRLVEDISERAVEEIMTEGSMLISGVDIDIRFGEPIEIKSFLQCTPIERDISSKRRIKFDDPLPSKRRMRKEALEIMQRYMSAIYGMTTVNHDHLFASMLRMLPFGRIDEHDLRRRVFLAAEYIRKKKGFYFHSSLSADQIHLLTDDRHNKARDFIGVALEKGILRKNGHQLVKDRSKFSSPYDFHRARIDNPIEVMANAVEPLITLQRLIQRLAWLPEFWLKRKIAKHLAKNASAEFEKDYEAYHIPGESKEKDVGAPFLMRGKNRKLGVVLIHGYMAAPLEVKKLARFLAQKGLWVYAPRVKGHGTSPDDLAERSYQEWIASVEVGYAIMQNLCKRIVVGGFSNGAGLALDLAARIDGVAGVIAVSTPLKLQYVSTKLVPAVDVWNRLMSRVRFDDAKKEFVDNHPENPHINYLRNPISGLRELERLMDSVEPRLPDIDIPALVVQSHRDPVVSPKGSEIIFNRLGSTEKSYVLFNIDRHGILLGDGSEKVHRVIWDFIAQL
ncbi:MAG: alpha/beta fold hydrolase [Deltaproteobacteria bacterium]|nr:MAG: alpha/beta fold hydrolase [Deltaproteobacteria bacterium]